MTEPSPAISALESFDISSRPDRAKRLIWLAQFEIGPLDVMGVPEVLDLKEEARVCYVNGFYVATLLTALACVEQMLSEELRPQPRTKKNRLALDELIKQARTANVADSATLDNTDRLRELRNAFSHQKDDDAQEFRLALRIQKQNKHPRVLLEEDAQLAIRTMHAMFQATLRPIRSE